MAENRERAELESGLERFYELTGSRVEPLVLRAPARLNLFGEHVDYVSYIATSSLAIGSHEHNMTMLAAPNGSERVRGWSDNPNFPAIEFSLAEIDEEIRQAGVPEWEQYLSGRKQSPPHWKLYVMGAAAFFLLNSRQSRRVGFDFLIRSEIPPQGGSSSSSALVVLAGAALRILAGVKWTGEALAEESSRAEWFVGTRGGSLDHSTICLARKGWAVHLSYQDHKHQLIDLPGDRYKWVSFFTQAADKGKEILLEYNERAAVSRLVIPALLGDSVDGIRDAVGRLPVEARLSELVVGRPDLEIALENNFPALYRERKDVGLRIRDRARHHLGEVERVNQAIEVLGTGQSDSAKMSVLGELLDETHDSLRDNYGVSVPMVEDLRDVLSGVEGVLGSRMIGGGFGGNVLALVEASRVSNVVERVEEAFYGKKGRQAKQEGAIRVSTPGDGLRQLTV